MTHDILLAIVASMIRSFNYDYSTSMKFLSQIKDVSFPSSFLWNFNFSGNSDNVTIMDIHDEQGTVRYDKTSVSVDEDVEDKTRKLQFYWTFETINVHSMICEITAVIWWRLNEINELRRGIQKSLQPCDWIISFVQGFRVYWRALESVTFLVN